MRKSTVKSIACCEFLLRKSFLRNDRPCRTFDSSRFHEILALARFEDNMQRCHAVSSTVEARVCAGQLCGGMSQFALLSSN